MSTASTDSFQNFEMATTSNQNINNIVFRKNINPKIRSRNIRRCNEVTKTLMLISFVFLLLHFPLALNKCWYFINSDFRMETNSETELINENQSKYKQNGTKTINQNRNQNFELREYEEIFERITCYIFYLNFSINFFLYTFNKSKFRHIIIKQIRCKWFKQKSNTREIYD